MSEPIAIQVPQPSSVGSSRLGSAAFAIGIAIGSAVFERRSTRLMEFAEAT